MKSVLPSWHEAVGWSQTPNLPHGCSFPGGRVSPRYSKCNFLSLQTLAWISLLCRRRGALKSCPCAVLRPVLLLVVLRGGGGTASSPPTVGYMKAAFNQSLPLHLFSGWMYAPSSPARADLVESSGKTGYRFHLLEVLRLLPHLISTDAANAPLAAPLKIPVLRYF